MVFVRIHGRCIIRGLTENLFIAGITTWRVHLAFAARINPNLPERAHASRSRAEEELCRVCVLRVAVQISRNATGKIIDPWWLTFHVKMGEQRCGS